MRRILKVHFPNISEDILENVVNAFYQLRELEGIEKRPATRELINWIRALRSDPDFKPKRLIKSDIPFLGVLFKKSSDYERANIFVNRRRRF